MNKINKNELVLRCSKPDLIIFRQFKHLSTNAYYFKIDFDLYLSKDFSKSISVQSPEEKKMHIK